MVETDLPSPPEERLLSYMRVRAEGHPTSNGTWTVRKGYVGSSVGELAADQGMTAMEVLESLSVLRDAHLIEFDRSREGTPVRIRVTGGRDQAFVDAWLAANQERAALERFWAANRDEGPVVYPEAPPVSIVPEGWHAVDPDTEPDLSLPILDGLPVIIALTRRGTATRTAALLLESAGMEALAAEVRLGAQEVTRLEREVLTLVERLADG